VPDLTPDPADALLADSERQGQEQRDVQAGRVWEVLVTVAGPTPGDAERWAGGIRDMVIGEFGPTMRLEVAVRPAGHCPGPGSTVDCDCPCYGCKHHCAAHRQPGGSAR
jgi:hypothetical protein